MLWKMRFSDAKIVPCPPYTPLGTIESSRGLRPSRALRGVFDSLSSPFRGAQTVKKPRRAREGRSPFDRAVPGSTCCRFSIRKAVQIYNVGTGRFLRRKIPFSREKSVSLQAPRPKNLRFLAETGEGGRKAENPLGFQVSPLAKLPTAQFEDLSRGTWRGACFPVHQLVKTFLTS